MKEKNSCTELEGGGGVGKSRHSAFTEFKACAGKRGGGVRENDQDTVFHYRRARWEESGKEKDSQHERK